MRRVGFEPTRENPTRSITLRYSLTWRHNRSATFPELIVWSKDTVCITDIIYGCHKEDINLDATNNMTTSYIRLLADDVPTFYPVHCMGNELENIKTRIGRKNSYW